MISTLLSKLNMPKVLEMREENSQSKNGLLIHQYFQIFQVRGLVLSRVKLESVVFCQAILLCHCVSSNFSYDMSITAVCFQKMVNVINNAVCK